MLKVAYLLESFNYTGAGRQVAALAAGLPRDEFEVCVAALGPWGPLAEVLAATGVTVRALDRRWRFDGVALLRLRQWLARWQPHVVHAWEFAANGYGRLATSGGARLIASQRRVDLGKSWFGEMLKRWQLRGAARIVATGESVRDAYLLRHGLNSRQKLMVIKPGVVPPRASDSKSQLLEELGLPDDAVLIAAAGRLTYDQRISDMLWCVEILGALFPQLQLLVVGDGPQRQALERLAGYLRRTELMHFLGHRDAAAILPHVDLLWHAGAEDRLPSAVLEAMAAGLPVVACDTPALRELIVPGETGLLFPLGDRPGLARCTQKLLEERALAKSLGDVARAHVAERFSMRAMIEQHADLYRTVARER